MHPILGWIIGIVGVVILGTLLDLFLSEHRMGKYIRSVFAAVTILVIVLPIPSLINNGFNFDTDFIIQNEWEFDQNFLNFADRMRMNSLQRGVEAQLSADGIAGARVEIAGSVVNQEIIVASVRINLTNAVIQENLAHINRYEHVATLIMRYLSIERGRVVVFSDD